MSLSKTMNQLETVLADLTVSDQSQDLEKKIAELSDEHFQQLFSRIMVSYVERLKYNSDLQPLSEDQSVTATDTVIAVTRILKQKKIEIFELGLWATMGAIK